MPKSLEGEKTPRVTLSLRVTPETKARIEADARASGRSLAVEGEARIEQSFEDEQMIAELRGTISALEGQIAAHKERDGLLWRTEADYVAAHVFALAIQQCQLLKGASWREDASVALTIGQATGEVLRKFARNRWSRCEGQSALSQLLGPVTDSRTADLVSGELFNHFEKSMPALPPLEPQKDPAQWSGMARVVVTLKDKATGQVVDTLEGPVQPISEMKGDQVPGLVEFTDRHRASKDKLDVDIAVVHVLRDEGSIWDARKAEA